jgi:hypothetical protein
MRQPVAASNPFQSSLGNGMGLTVHVSDNPALNSAVFWLVVLGLGYAGLSLGYYTFTGHSLLGSGRMPAAWVF